MVESHYIPQGLANAVMKQPLQIHPNARFIAHSQPYIFDYIQWAAGPEVVRTT